MKQIEKNVEKLKTYMGRTYQHKTKETKHVFQSYQQKGDEIIIATDGDWIKTNVYDLLAVLQQYEFVPTASHEVSVIEDKKQQVTIPMKTVNNDVMNKLLDTLMDNIEKVKQNKEYVPQAQTINSHVQSVINLAKLEIDIRTKL